MKRLLGFTFGKIGTSNLKFHYLRVGKAGSLLDRLCDLTVSNEIEWVQHEANTFRQVHFGNNYGKCDAAIVNMAIDEDNLTQERRDFWENFIWKTEHSPLAFALVIPDSNKYGSLTRSQIMEGLSLIRINDRPFEIFENIENCEIDIVEWMTRISSIVHRKDRDDDETELS